MPPAQPAPSFIQNLCLGIPVKEIDYKTADGQLHAYMAQVVAKVLFEKYFKGKYGENAKVLMEGEYRSIRFGGIVDKVEEGITFCRVEAFGVPQMRCQRIERLI